MTVDKPAPEAEIIIEDAAPAPVLTSRPRTVYGGMWGPVEIAATAIAGLALLASLLMYFFVVLPSSRELQRNRTEAARLETEVVAARSKFGDMTSAQDGVNKVVTSVDDFETRFLPSITNGQTALYQRLNGLIKAYGLTNTSGPDYAPLDIADQNNQTSDGDKGRAKFRSLYPGVYISTTLEGSYQNLRRFIRDLETGNEFVLISSIELAPSDSDGKKKGQNPAADAAPGAPVATTTQGPAGRAYMQPGGQPVMQPQFPTGVGGGSQVKPKPGKARGELVSLRIELAAYFRRPNFSPGVSAMTN